MTRQHLTQHKCSLALTLAHTCGGTPMAVFKNIPVVLVGLSLVLVAGCAASGRAFEPISVKNDESVVYVYRPTHSYAGSAVSLPIRVDGEHIGRLPNSGYVYRLLTPGRHVVSSSTEVKAEVPFEAEGGKAYYISAGLEMGYFVGRPNLTMVPEEQGKLAILGTKYAGKKDAPQQVASVQSR
jgi:hypothetical protein